MTGRVLSELLRDGPAPASINVEKTVQRVTTKTATGEYQLTLHKSRVGQTEYVDYTETTR